MSSMKNIYDAVMIAEGVVDVDSEKEYFDAWQSLIDSGYAWSLQGWFGRTAVQLIEEGVCHE